MMSPPPNHSIRGHNHVIDGLNRSHLHQPARLGRAGGAAGSFSAGLTPCEFG
jgi:hypothetical protein